MEKKPDNHNPGRISAVMGRHLLHVGYQGSFLEEVTM